MSDLRGEGQGWFEALLQRGVEDEVEAPNIKLHYLIFSTGRYHYASCYYDSGIYQALYHPGDINLDGLKVSAGPMI